MQQFPEPLTNVDHLNSNKSDLCNALSGHSLIETNKMIRNSMCGVTFKMAGIL